VIALTLETVAAYADGRLDGGSPDAAVTGVSIDSRSLSVGDLFVALPGGQTDGHDFLADAVQRGACGVLVREDAEVPPGAAAVRVADPGSALAALAAKVRERLDARVVAITGSSGKTITKDMTAAVARASYRTVANEASFNNEIGVPLTILQADGSTEVLVAEVGSRGVGHIASLMPMLRPDVSVVVNVGTAHIGMFGSAETIALAKGELVEQLGPDGFAVLNADDPAVDAMASRTRARVIRFGTSGAADVRATAVTLGADAYASFTLVAPDGDAPVHLRIPGEHLVSDALAAAAAGHALGVGVSDVARALGSVRPAAWRMELVDAPGGWRVLNDAYNANPASMLAALKTLMALGRGARTWAVLGYMAELGEHEVPEHDRIGRLAVRLGVGRLIAVGKETRPMFEAARLEGMTTEELTMVEDGDEAIALLRRELRPGDVVLVKASRAAGLERVAIALSQEESA
jgi:UDP-N-acetylmuramoyl-tripeptide--D-alanyl-D-alanine ligase